MIRAASAFEICDFQPIQSGYPNTPPLGYTLHTTSLANIGMISAGLLEEDHHHALKKVY